jgi:hypothetical protein
MGITIEPTTFYRLHDLRDLTGLSVRMLGDACRRGDLRSTMRGQVRFVRGAWMIEWLDSDRAPSAPSKEKGDRAI